MNQRILERFEFQPLPCSGTRPGCPRGTGRRGVPGDGCETQAVLGGVQVPFQPWLCALGVRAVFPVPQIIRLREEGSRQLEEQQRLIREQIRLEREQHRQGEHRGAWNPHLQVVLGSLAAYFFQLSQQKLLAGKNASEHISYLYFC